MPPPKAGPSPLGGGGCLPKVVGWDRRASPPSGGDPGRVGWGGRACSRLPAAGRPASLALMGASEPPCARTTFVPSPTSLRRALLSVPAPPTPVLDCPRPPCLGAAAKPGASGRAVGLAVGSGGGTCARGPRPGQPRCTGDLGSARRGKRWAGARSRGRGAKPPPPPARRRASRASVWAPRRPLPGFSHTLLFRGPEPRLPATCVTAETSPPTSGLPEGKLQPAPAATGVTSATVRVPREAGALGPARSGSGVRCARASRASGSLGPRRNKLAC